MTDDTDNGEDPNAVAPEILPPEAAEKLEQELGPDAVKTVEGVLIASREITMGGPLPVSSEFAAYEQVLPGAAREILDMAKAEQSHRHSCNNRDLNGGIIHQFTALILGAALLAGCIAGSIYLAVNGHSAIAAALLGVAVLGVITSIIKSRPMFTGRVVEKEESKAAQSS